MTAGRRRSSSSARRRKPPSSASEAEGTIASSKRKTYKTDNAEDAGHEMYLSFPQDESLRDALSFYYARCELHKRKPDPSFAIALQARSQYVIARATDFSLEDLLPVCETLAKKNTHIERLCLNWCALGPMASVALAACLRENQSVRILEITGNDITDDAAEAIAVLIRSAKLLEEVDLHSNAITTKGAQLLADAIREAKHDGSALQKFRITNNYLRQQGVDLMEAATTGHDGHFHVDLRDGNFMCEEVWNAITHGLGCASAIACLVVLCITCSTCEASYRYWTAALIYGISQLTMFLCSTLFHSFHRCGPSDIFGILDHAAIYILIAGTYSPYLLVTRLYDDHFAISMGTMVIIWSLALLGIVIDLAADKTNVIIQRLSLLLYVIMGWFVVFISPWLFPLLSSKAVTLLELGGIVYTAGVYFFIKGNDKPSYHVVWHVFVHAASLLHFFSVMDLLDNACKGHLPLPLTDA